MKKNLMSVLLMSSFLFSADKAENIFPDEAKKIVWKNNIGKFEGEPIQIVSKTYYLEQNKDCLIKHCFEIEVVKRYYTEKAHSNGIVERMNNCQLSSRLGYKTAEEKFNGTN